MLLSGKSFENPAWHAKPYAALWTEKQGRWYPCRHDGRNAAARPPPERQPTHLTIQHAIAASVLVVALAARLFINSPLTAEKW